MPVWRKPTSGVARRMVSAVELEDQPQDAVSGGMLRADVQTIVSAESGGGVMGSAISGSPHR
jgi:hypothetical protein